MSAPRFDVKVRRVSGQRGAFEVCAWSRGRKLDIGCVVVGRAKDKKTFRVQWSWVLDEYRRRRVATKLYRRAAHEACKRGAPLCSDTERSVMSNSFWKKQFAKKRATWVPRFYFRLFGGRFCLRCPAPNSLSAPR